MSRMDEEYRKWADSVRWDRATPEDGWYAGYEAGRKSVNAELYEALEAIAGLDMRFACHARSVAHQAIKIARAALSKARGE